MALNLLYPYSWESRTPTLADQIFFVPPFFTAHENYTFPKWTEIFGNENDVNIEFCSGNGGWILEKSKNEPDFNWVAVEKRFDRARQIWLRAKKLSLHNLFIINGEALTFSKNYINDDSVNGVFINFPDPWPKNRHAKNRLISPAFIQNLHRILKNDKGIIFVTDHSTMSKTTIAYFHKSQLFFSTLPAPYYVNEWPNYGSSYFESLWREQGKEIYYHHFVKT